MKNKLIYLLVVLFTYSCTPDYYTADEAEIGYALMTNVYGYPEPDTLYCLHAEEVPLWLESDLVPNPR